MAPLRKKVTLALAVALSALACGLLARRWFATPYARPCRVCVTLPSPGLPPPEPEAGHERLGPPQPGDWRQHYHEAPQTLEQYVASDVNRRCPHRTTIYVQVLDSRPGRLGLKPACAARYAEVVERMRD